ncbi:hypothetical protein F5X68DRAFT_258632 [Plectosphaerella plurivora]|uniref:NACHT domain-containing protein n=1 Tax=Plectosphaerella plurivora TaxID=936078 RepID=A0A9P9ABU3_9PEZI|nr:hypothetical protein F5X68DRAFT_258632 [Plectosphaerella plurivora]
MADPLGIIGVIAVAGQILSLTVKLGLDWKDAPEDAKSFLNEIQTLKTVLSETHTNIIVNEDFRAAFEGRRSALLQELGDLNSTDTQPTSTNLMVGTCKKLLDDLLLDLKKRTEGHRFGWDRLKGAFINKRTKETVGDLHRQCQTLNSLINLDALSLGLETHKEVKQARQEQRDWQNDQMSRTILDWLSEADYAAQQSDFLRRRQAGTGQWLLESQEYRQWVATPETTLFCPGIPGAGKTVLTSIVVNDLQDRFLDDPGVSIAYLYCNFRRQTEQTLENLLSSILRQLAQDQPSLPECVQALYDAKRGMRPSSEQLSSTLQVLVKSLPRSFIIIDALDECHLAEGSRAQFLDEIFALQLGSNFNLFATSRFIMDITDRFNDAPSLEIRAHEEDVRRYLAGSISQLPACVVKNPQLQEEIMARIVEAVDGMFLLAQLHLNSLKGKRSAKIIRAALGALHTGSGAYDKAYDDAMERIAGQLEDQEDLAKQVLMWITCAVRPLTTIELQEALAVELGEPELDPDNVPEIEDILSVCAGLVTVDDESDIIRLVHYTTQEYFSRTSDPKIGNAVIVRTLLDSDNIDVNTRDWLKTAM